MQIPDIEANPSTETMLRRVVKVIVWLLPSMVAIGVAVFFYFQWQGARDVANGQVEGVTEQQAEEAKKEIDEVVEELSRIVLLPGGETPTLSTITNKDELTENREFFQNAVNGDKVLVYQQAKKAFLYRPSTKKLINLAPIDITDANQAQPTAAATTDQSPSPAAAEDESADEKAESFTVVLRNGTGKQGLTYDFEPKLLDISDQAEILDRNNAAQDDYTESVVVVVNLAKKAVAQRVASELGLKMVNLPTGESKGEADILIILGADQL